MSDINVTPVVSADLTALPAQIELAVQEVYQHANGMVMAAVRAGRLLKLAKAAMRHGEWELWLKANCTVAPRTAQAYMRLADKLEMLPAKSATSVADLPLRAALKAITTSPTAPPRQSAWIQKSSGQFEKSQAVLDKAAKALSSARRSVKFGALKRKHAASLRLSLQAAINELDDLQREDEVVEMEATI